MKGTLFSSFPPIPFGPVDGSSFQDQPGLVLSRHPGPAGRFRGEVLVPVGLRTQPDRLQRDLFVRLGRIEEKVAAPDLIPPTLVPGSVLYDYPN
jgi:hypothetical protein